MRMERKYILKLDKSLIDKEEVFDWTSGDGEVTLHFRTTALKRFLGDNPEYRDDFTKEVEIEEDFAEYLYIGRGLEPTVLAKYTYGKIDEPVIGCMLGNGHLLLVDGNHRYFMRYKLGYKTVKYHVIPKEVWEHFLIPEEVWGRHIRESHSRVTAPAHQGR